MATPSSDDVGRITVSRDALRAELATMELRLVEKLATQTEVEAVRKEAHAELEAVTRDVEALQRWRSFLTGVAMTALGMASACTAFVIYALTN